MRIERRKLSLPDVKLDVEPDESGIFSGYGAYFGNEDAYSDVIERGAFKDTIKEWKGRRKWPPMLLQHGGGMFSESPDGMLPVGQWTHMEEDSKGLKVEGKLFALNTERGQYIYEGLRSGALDGLSIGYKVREQRRGTRAGEPERTLLNIDLWEVSIVTFPANDKARITGVKTLTADQSRHLESILGERGLSRRDRAIAVSAFKNWLQRDAEAPGSTLREEAVPGDMGSADAALAADQLLARILSGSLRY
jgi:HK97 family phage prohead protease